MEKQKEKQRDEFWNQYIQPFIPDIISGKTWPEFTQRSITDLNKLDFVLEREGKWYIGHKNEVFVVNKSGDCLKVSYKGKTYFPPIPVKIDVHLEK